MKKQRHQRIHPESATIISILLIVAAVTGYDLFCDFSAHASGLQLLSKSTLPLAALGTAMIVWQRAYRAAKKVAAPKTQVEARHSLREFADQLGQTSKSEGSAASTRMKSAKLQPQAARPLSKGDFLPPPHPNPPPENTQSL